MPVTILVSDAESKEWNTVTVKDLNHARTLFKSYDTEFFAISPSLTLMVACHGGSEELKSALRRNPIMERDFSYLSASWYGPAIILRENEDSLMDVNLSATALKKVIARDRKQREKYNEDFLADLESLSE